MREKFKHVLVMVAIYSVLLPIVTAPLFVHTDSPTTILYVDPPTIEDPTILPNDTIIIRIVLSVVADMKTCEFNLTFDPDILSIQRVTKLLVQGQYPQSSMDIDEIEGYLWMSLTYASPVSIASDTGLVEIEFFVRGYGATSLHFESSTLLDGSGALISHETHDGFVRIFIRDIAVYSIYLPCSETYVGRIIPIDVIVVNEGDIPENFTVSLFYDSTLIETKSVTNLQPKENTTLTFNWDTNTVLPRLAPYTIKAEASILSYEAETLDNTLIDGTIKIKIVGDVNGDGTVDIDDLTAWDEAYLSSLGDPNWNEQADINMDGIVDKTDGAIIVEHYHETL